MSDIKFFGEVDLHTKKGTVASEYPAWYFDRPLDELSENIDKMERAIARGTVPADKLSEMREHLQQYKERYTKIMESCPKLTDAEKDKLVKVRRDMGKQITDGLFSRSHMQKGTVDAHKEAERMVKPMIDVKPEYHDLLRACNVRIVNGKITRDGMAKAWKIIGKLLNRHGGDEETNVETLRRD
jgi:soluble cytochrome b562